MIKNFLIPADANKFELVSHENKKGVFQAPKLMIMAKEIKSNSNSNTANAVKVEFTPREIVISGIVKNYRSSGSYYHAGTNPWNDETTITFQLGQVWLEYNSWGNYTSQGKTLREVEPQAAVTAASSLRDDDGAYIYASEAAPEKEINLSVPLKSVEELRGGRIGELLSEEREWRESHIVCDESVVPQILEAVGGRYEFVDDPKGIHDRIVRAVADGKLYSVDVERRAGMGYWIYDATVRPFDPEAEADARKAFGRKVAALSKKSGVPFEVVKILGSEQLEAPEAGRVLHLLNLVHQLPKSEGEKHELSCGIARRTAAMASLLPEEVYNFFHVGSLGQNRNWVLAGYIAG